MAGALWLAQRLGRELVVDWRGMDFLKDKTRNYFTEYFAPLHEFDGVPVHYAPAADIGDHVDAPPDDRREITPGEHLSLVDAGSAAFPRYLVLTTYHGLDRMPSGDATTDHFRLRGLYRALALRPELQEKADAFYDERLAGGFIVGINLATGNMPSPTGRYYYGRFDTGIFNNRERFFSRVTRAVSLALRRLPRELQENRRIFYATDSAWMSELLGRLPGSHTRRQVFPPPGAGRSFDNYDQLGYSDNEASEDMVIDHFLLGRCDALVYNGSMFSNYARVRTNYFSGNSRDIDSLFAKYWTVTAARYARQGLSSLRR
jgi:hypothetical protein